MANTVKDKNGSRRIQFVAPDGRRPSIRLGKVSQRAAESFRFRVEQLLAAKITGHALESDTAHWLSGLEATMTDRLARVGLIDAPGSVSNLTLNDHLENYFTRRTDVADTTQVRWRQSSRSLIQFFGASRPIASITAGEARDFERWLMTADARRTRYAESSEDDGLATNTVRKRIGHAKQFFQDAVLRELLTRNPFTGMKGTAGSNRERDFFIDREMATKVLDACPNAEWRLIFALSRFGGLRCPSEHVALRLDDVNWAEDRFRVRSPKTKRYEGKGERMVPIFPELRPYLEAVFDLSKPGTEFFITSYRNPKQNPRTQFERIICRAGLTPWPKLFHNLRASRATELANEHPAHVAAAWLGHSTTIASKHYWQVTDADFEKAAKKCAECGALDAETVQNPAQQAHAASRKSSHESPQPSEDTGVMRQDAKHCGTVQTPLMTPTGLEPVLPA